MAEMIPNAFTTYELTDKEIAQAPILTALQIQYLQNQLANAAEEKLALIFDPLNPTVFVQQEASLKGQMDILMFLIDASATAIDLLNNPVN